MQLSVLNSFNEIKVSPMLDYKTQIEREIREYEISLTQDDNITKDQAIHLLEKFKEDKSKDYNLYAKDYRDAQIAVVTKAFTIGKNTLGAYCEERYNETKTAIEKMEEIDPEAVECFGTQVLIKFETVAPKLNKEFFDELTKEGITLQDVDFAVKELNNFNAQVPEKYIDELRRRVGFIDYSKTTGTLVKVGDEAFKVKRYKVLQSGDTEIYFEDKPNAPKVGDKVLVSKESGYTYKDKDNVLYRLMDANNINGKLLSK